MSDARHNPPNDGKMDGSNQIHILIYSNIHKRVAWDDEYLVIFCNNLVQKVYQQFYHIVTEDLN